MNNFHIKSVKIKNFRSFRDAQVINFDTKKNNNITAIFGPNASGKSNTAQALLYIWSFVLNSSNPNILKPPYDPFRLNDRTATEDSEFELLFTSNGRNFRYSFSVNTNRVSYENLEELSDNLNRPEQIFNRKYDAKTKAYRYSMATAKHRFGQKITNSTRPEALLLTVGRAYNNEYSNIIFDWIEHINILIGEAPNLREISLAHMGNDKTLKDNVVELLRDTDFWIRDLKIEKTDMPKELIDALPFIDSVKTTMRKMDVVKTVHAVRNNEGDIVGTAEFNLDGEESAGTRRFFELAAPIIETLKTGSILYLDEFGAHIHPDVCKYILYMFANKSINKLNAQLIINTHDTSLMEPNGYLKRDNIILVEKDMTEQSIVKPLSDKPIRVDEQLEKRYRQGLYGAKPFINIREG